MLTGSHSHPKYYVKLAQASIVLSDRITVILVFFFYLKLLSIKFNYFARPKLILRRTL